MDENVTLSFYPNQVYLKDLIDPRKRERLFSVKLVIYLVRTISYSTTPHIRIIFSFCIIKVINRLDKVCHVNCFFDSFSFAAKQVKRDTVPVPSGKEVMRSFFFTSCL